LGNPAPQVLSVDNEVDENFTAGAVESLTHAMGRTSIEAKPRSSFALSVVTGYSAAASQTRSSFQSLFNPSLTPGRVSWYSGLSRRSSHRSFNSASTIPSVMAGPMLYSNEELVNSRESGSRLERYVPSILQPKKVRQERLWIAVQGGITQDVADILESSAGSIDVNCLDDNGWSPLITATFNNQDRIVALLLDQDGIDVSYRDTTESTASMYAHRLGHSKIKDMLEKHERSANPSRRSGNRFFIWPVRDKHREVQEKLFEIQREWDESDESDNASRYENSSQPESDIASSSRYLWLACEQGNADSVARLIAKSNVDPNSVNSRRRTPLSIAASYGHEDVVRKLLEHSEVDVTIQDVNGATALTWAASRGHLRIMNLLLSSEPATGRNQEIRCAALKLAQRKGHELIVKALTASSSQKERD
jgi:ankyrin repeat protein